LAQGYLVVKVNWSRENRNEAFLSQYPSIRGYPHIFVLEKDGTFLHSQNTAELEEGRSYDLDVMLAFLDRWAPPSTTTASRYGNASAAKHVRDMRYSLVSHR